MFDRYKKLRDEAEAVNPALKLERHKQTGIVLTFWFVVAVGGFYWLMAHFL